MGQDRTAVDEAIKHLVATKEFDQQQAIVDALRNEYNIKISQATVSRYLDRLGIIWEPNRERYVLGSEVERLAKEKELKELLISSCDTAYPDCPTIVLKTTPGYAEILATKLKETYPEDILGTIAQHDMLLVFLEETDFQDTLMELAGEAFEEYRNS